jgi:signal peptidase I
LNKKAKILVKYSEYALTTAIFVLIAYSAIAYASGSAPFYVVSDYPSSMTPTMNYATIGVTYHTSFQGLKVGDIIVFHDPYEYSKTIVHRIVGIVPCDNGNSCLLTKGDNNATNPTRDPWNVTTSDYIGQVIMIVPYVGYLSPTLWGLEGVAIVLPFIFVALLLGFFYYSRGQKEEGSPAEKCGTPHNAPTS